MKLFLIAAFGAALVLGEVVTRALGLKESDMGEAYQ